MTSESLPYVPGYTPTPPTTVELDYADLPIIDLSKAATLEGKLFLASQVKQAVVDYGFFYVVNHGYSQEKVKRIFDIANATFEQVADDTKRKYEARIRDAGTFEGYKLREHWVLEGGVRDQIETYSINRDVYRYAHPEPIRPFLPEIDEFAKQNHFHVLHPILRLLALGLELDEETFVNTHGFDAAGESMVRFIKYYPRTPDGTKETGKIWMKGHTDFGSITMLYSQPVAALQILTSSGEWKWIRHIENALVINVGDVMEFLSGGFYRATIHRVSEPPPDQKDYTRVGAFYFAFPDDDAKLAPLLHSPVLQRISVKRRFENGRAPTTEQWRKERTRSYGPSEILRKEEHVITGAAVKHFYH